jgi:hypothetical protein
MMWQIGFNAEAPERRRGDRPNSSPLRVPLSPRLCVNLRPYLLKSYILAFLLYLLAFTL